MTDTLADLVIHYGVWLILAATFLSCLGVPVPTSLIMLSAGAFAAGDDLSLSACAAAALIGAVLGDQTGYALGRRWSALLHRARGKTALMVAKARDFTTRHGGPGVFLSRWLFSPLGPYVNYIAGGTGMGWARFSVFSVLGETVWVTIYLGAGHAFADELETVATVLGNASWAAAGLAITLVLGHWLWRHSAPKRPPPT